MSLHAPHQFRIRTGKLASDDSYGANGAFRVPLGTRYAMVIASDGAAMNAPCWEHVSVSFQDRCPTWDEMCRIKALFWDPEDVVMQLHPAESEWVNNYPFCLHLWKAVGVDIPVPPAILVGIRSLGTLKPSTKARRFVTETH